MSTTPTATPKTPGWLGGGMEALGFSQPSTEDVFSLAVCTQGPEKEGKTHWAFTAPEPIVAVASDTGTLGVARKARQENRRVAVYEYRVPPSNQSKTEYEREWLKVEKALTAILLNKNIRSGVIDTGTEIWEMLRLARFGKLTQVMPHQYGPVNNEMKDLVKAMVDRADLNTVWIHKLKKEYKTNKAGTDSWTGKFERAGFGDMPYLCDVVVEHFFDMEEREFGIRVKGSRYNATHIVGQEYRGDLCNFAMLAAECFPTTDLDYWL